MLSYLSSWLEGDSDDDPLDVVCTDFEDDSEWVWVVVTPRDSENIETLLEEYLVVPPSPATKNAESASTSNPIQMPYKNALRRDLRVRKKKRYSNRLKIYPPLKIRPQECVKKALKACLRNKHRAAPYECRADVINKSLENLRLELAMPQSVPGTGHTNILEIRTPRVYKDSQGFTLYKPRNRPRVICDPFESLSAEGWSVLVDPNGEFLSSSMVRIWSIRNRLKDQEKSRLMESLGSKGADPLKKVLERNPIAPLENNQMGSCALKRRKRGRKHELTAKPGHTSLLNKKPCELSIVPWYGEIDLSPWYDIVWPADDVRVSRRIKSLMRTYKEVFLTLQYYLAQLLDSLVGTDDEELACCERKTHSEVKPYDKFSVQRARSGLSYQKRNQKMNGRKKLGRWNAAKLKRRDRAVCMRKKAMGKGRQNCAVRRSF